MKLSRNKIEKLLKSGNQSRKKIHSSRSKGRHHNKNRRAKSLGHDMHDDGDMHDMHDMHDDGDMHDTMMSTNDHPMLTDDDMVFPPKNKNLRRRKAHTERARKRPLNLRMKSLKKKQNMGGEQEGGIKFTDVGKAKETYETKYRDQQDYDKLFETLYSPGNIVTIPKLNIADKYTLAFILINKFFIPAISDLKKNEHRFEDFFVLFDEGRNTYYNKKYKDGIELFKKMYNVDTKTYETFIKLLKDRTATFNLYDFAISKNKELTKLYKEARENVYASMSKMYIQNIGTIIKTILIDDISKLKQSDLSDADADKMAAIYKKIFTNPFNIKDVKTYVIGKYIKDRIFPQIEKKIGNNALKGWNRNTLPSFIIKEALPLIEKEFSEVNTEKLKDFIYTNVVDNYFKGEGTSSKQTFHQTVVSAKLAKWTSDDIKYKEILRINKIIDDIVKNPTSSANKSKFDEVKTAIVTNLLNIYMETRLRRDAETEREINDKLYDDLKIKFNNFLEAGGIEKIKEKSPGDLPPVDLPPVDLPPENAVPGTVPETVPAVPGETVPESEPGAAPTSEEPIEISSVEEGIELLNDLIKDGKISDVIEIQQAQTDIKTIQANIEKFKKNELTSAEFKNVINTIFKPYTERYFSMGGGADLATAGNELKSALIQLSREGRENEDIENLKKSTKFLGNIDVELAKWDAAADTEPLKTSMKTNFDELKNLITGLKKPGTITTEFTSFETEYNKLVVSPTPAAESTTVTDTSGGGSPSAKPTIDASAKLMATVNETIRRRTTYTPLSNVSKNTDKKPLGADLKKKLGVGITPSTSTPTTTTNATAAATSAELNKLKKEVEDLKAKLDSGEKLDENESAIRAIMMGQDSLAHHIKFLVDIPKWQQFKVFDEGVTTIEDIAQQIGLDQTREKINENIKDINVRTTETGPELQTTVDALKQVVNKGTATKLDLQQIIKDFQEIRQNLETIKKDMQEIINIQENASGVKTSSAKDGGAKDSGAITGGAKYLQRGGAVPGAGADPPTTEEKVEEENAGTVEGTVEGENEGTTPKLTPTVENEGTTEVTPTTTVENEGTTLEGTTEVTLQGTDENVGTTPTPAGATTLAPTCVNSKQGVSEQTINEIDEKIKKVNGYIEKINEKMKSLDVPDAEKTGAEAKTVAPTPTVAKGGKKNKRQHKSKNLTRKNSGKYKQWGGVTLVELEEQLKDAQTNDPTNKNEIDRLTKLITQKKAPDSGYMTVEDMNRTDDVTPEEFINKQEEYNDLIAIIEKKINNDTEQPIKEEFKDIKGFYDNFSNKEPDISKDGLKDDSDTINQGIEKLNVLNEKLPEPAPLPELVDPAANTLVTAELVTDPAAAELVTDSAAELIVPAAELTANPEVIVPAVVPEGETPEEAEQRKLEEECRQSIEKITALSKTADELMKKFEENVKLIAETKQELPGVPNNNKKDGAKKDGNGSTGDGTSSTGDGTSSTGEKTIEGLINSIEEEFTNEYDKLPDVEKKEITNETNYERKQKEIAAAKKGDKSFEKWAGDDAEKKKKVVEYLEKTLTGINNFITVGKKSGVGSSLIASSGVFPNENDPRKEEGEGSASKEEGEGSESTSASEEGSESKEGSAKKEEGEETPAVKADANAVVADKGGSKSKRSNHKRTKRIGAKHISAKRKSAKHIGTKRKRKSAKHIGTKRKRKSAKHKHIGTKHKQTTAKKH